MQLTIAVDVAKSVFQVAESPRPGRVSRELRLSRRQFERYLAQIPPARILFEACGSSHHWARQALAAHHTPVQLALGMYRGLAPCCLRPAAAAPRTTRQPGRRRAAHLGAPLQGRSRPANDEATWTAAGRQAWLDDSGPRPRARKMGLAQRRGGGWERSLRQGDPSTRAGARPRRCRGVAGRNGRARGSRAGQSEPRERSCGPFRRALPRSRGAERPRERIAGPRGMGLACAPGRNGRASGGETAQMPRNRGVERPRESGCKDDYQARALESCSHDLPLLLTCLLLHAIRFHGRPTPASQQG